MFIESPFKILNQNALHWNDKYSLTSTNILKKDNLEIFPNITKMRKNKWSVKLFFICERNVISKYFYHR